MTPVASLMLFLLSHLLVLHYVEGKQLCPSYFCNEIVGYIHFPFKSSSQPPECGLYTVDCSNSSTPKIQLIEGGYWHDFDSISQTNSVHINDKELLGSSVSPPLPVDQCSDEVLNDLSLPSPSPIFDVLFTHNLTLFKCPLNLVPPPDAHLTFGCFNTKHIYYTLYNKSIPSPAPACSVTRIPILPEQSTLIALTTNFSLQVQVTAECYGCYENRDGRCLVVEGKFKCSKGDDYLAIKLGLGAGAGAGGLVILVLVVCCFRRNLPDKSIFFWMSKTQSRQIVQEFLVDNGLLQVKRYSYLDVKKMTNSFKEKLGQGGYGGVYKGKLNDGRLLAVKVLNRPKGDGEDFMNEVAAISRTSHVNIVSLLGFCFEGSERALIYEFMPNGSLEKFIFDANNSQEDRHLGWEALDRIALGIARGLEYLHHGCNTRILHFDIKPHNILLNENFSPKISDFGLAKICKGDESIVSMMRARGTPGYIAPEVFCRNFGGVSHKSDVYSYGMMLSEMVGGRRNINAEVENTSEIYFPHWIYKRLELDEELGLESIMNEEDKVLARKMVIVSLWCIQTDPSNRPAMKQVIEMLEGSVDSLQIPPKPYLSSPPKSLAETAHSSSTLVSPQ